MARVLRSLQARDDLKQIGLYIARESGEPEIARRFLRRIGAVAEQYARQPLMATPLSILNRLTRGREARLCKFVTAWPLGHGLNGCFFGAGILNGVALMAHNITQNQHHAKSGD